MLSSLQFLNSQVLGLLTGGSPFLHAILSIDCFQDVFVFFDTDDFIFILMLLAVSHTLSVHPISSCTDISRRQQ